MIRYCARRMFAAATIFLDLVVCCVFFFFQAEDGIRDLTVTGVQTCALPISRGCPRAASACVSKGRWATWPSLAGGRSDFTCGKKASTCGGEISRGYFQ